MKSKRGVTLITLIITIIILIILAGISISALVTGENGVISRTITAKNKTVHADAEERLEAEIVGCFDTTGEINLDKLNHNLLTDLEGKVEFKYENESESESESESDYTTLSDSNKITKIPVIIKYKSATVEVTEDFIS